MGRIGRGRHDDSTRGQSACGADTGNVLSAKRTHHQTGDGGRGFTDPRLEPRPDCRALGARPAIRVVPLGIRAKRLHAQDEFFDDAVAARSRRTGDGQEPNGAVRQLACRRFDRNADVRPARRRPPPHSAGDDLRGGRNDVRELPGHIARGRGSSLGVGQQQPNEQSMNGGGKVRESEFGESFDNVEAVRDRHEGLGASPRSDSDEPPNQQCAQAEAVRRRPTTTGEDLWRQESRRPGPHASELSQVDQGSTLSFGDDVRRTDISVMRAQLMQSRERPSDGRTISKRRSQRTGTDGQRPSRNPVTDQPKRVIVGRHQGPRDGQMR